MNRVIALLIAPTLLSVAAPAFAQSKEDRAFEHFDRGAKLYFDGEFRAAIEEFDKGYALQPHPMFKVNIAVAFWRLGELPLAVRAADMAWREQDELEPEVAAENVARRHTFSVMRIAGERAEAIAAEAPAVEEVVVVEPPPAPEARSGLSPIGWAGAATAGAGAVLLVSWGVAEVGLTDDVEALEAAATSTRTEYDSRFDDLQRKQSTARILLGLGIGVTAIGGGLLVYDLVGQKDAAVSLLPAPDGFSVGLSTRF